MADYSQKRAGNYTLISKLGDGGFATVYLAQHTILEKKAAVKLLLPEWIEEADVVSRFFDEARTMESVHEHPNIVKIIDIATKEKCQEEGLPPYFIMEYLEGKSLEDIMKDPNKQFSLEEIVKIMDSALSALQFCHNKGVVHRDIKPSNFMLDADGVVKLTDFGIAKAAENTSKTGEGLTLGSTDYMSPEQALGKRDLDYRSDIYSLGVTLYQICCDRLPFIGDSANAVALKHIQEKPVPPIEILGDACPKRLNKVILKAMEKEREHRYQSCDEMREDLDKLLDPNAPDDDDYRSNDVGGGKTAAHETMSLDLSRLRPDTDDDDFSREEFDASTNYTGYTTKKMATKPPMFLVNFFRILLLMGLASVFFLAVFQLYTKYTNVSLNFETDPAGAEIYVNDAMVGTSPVQISLSPMQYRVSYKLDGYDVLNKLYQGESGITINASVELTKTDTEAKETIKKSVSNFNELLASIPESPGKSKKEQAAYEEARRNANRAFDEIERLYNSHNSSIAYGKAYVEAAQKLDRMNEACGRIAEVAKKKDTCDMHTLYAIACMKAGNNEEAKRQLDAAYIQDKDNKEMLNAYGSYYLALGDNAQAIPFLEMSVFLYPEQPEIKEILAKAKEQ